MNADNIPYTGEEARRLADIFFKLGVPCFGPSTAMDLLRVVEGLDKVLNDYQKELTPNMVVLINGYRTRIADIVAIAAHQQGKVIGHLETLLQKEDLSAK